MHLLKLLEQTYLLRVHWGGLQPLPECVVCAGCVGYGVCGADLAHCLHSPEKKKMDIVKFFHIFLQIKSKTD